MALLTCPECGAYVSSRADACPSCHCPVAEFPKPAEQVEGFARAIELSESTQPGGNRMALAVVVGLVVLVGHLLLTVAMTESWQRGVEGAVAQSGDDSASYDPALFAKWRDENEPGGALKLLWTPITWIAMSQSGGAIPKWAMAANACLWGAVGFLAIPAWFTRWSPHIMRWHLLAITVLALMVVLPSMCIFGLGGAALMGLGTYTAAKGIMQLILSGARPATV